jgi:hypothetical protein
LLLAFLVLVAAVTVPLIAVEANRKTVAVMGDSLTAQSVPQIEAFFGLFHDQVDPVALAGSGILDTEVPWQAEARNLVATHDPSMVVVEFIGDYGFFGARPGVTGGSPAFYAQWKAAAQQLENTLTARGAKVYWVLGPPVANPSLQATIDQLNGIYEQLHAPNTHSGHPPLINITPALTGGTGRYAGALPARGGGSIAVRTPDGTHFTLYGANLYAHSIALALGPS